MDSKRERRNLVVEELEDRVAPMGLVYTEPVNPDPPQPGSGGGGPVVSATASLKDKRGRAYGHQIRDLKKAGI